MPSFAALPQGEDGPAASPLSARIPMEKHSMLANDKATATDASTIGQPRTRRARLQRCGAMKWNSNAAKLIALALIYFLMMLQERDMLPSFIGGSRPDTSIHHMR